MNAYCFDYVQKTDKDRFLLALMAPPLGRDALWPLFAFNQEIAKTREVVSETTIGLIRLQWWRDAIAEIYDGKQPREHAVVTPLAEAIKKHALPRELFDNLVYAREFDLEGVAPANKTGLINYCDFTNTPLNQLALHILSSFDLIGGSIDTPDTIKTISVNYGLIGLVRALPVMLSQRRVMIPQDILKAYDLDEAKLVDFNQREKLPAIMKEILDMTDFTVTPKSKFLKRMNKMTRLYADQIKSVNYDVFDPRLAISPKFLALRLIFYGIYGLNSL